MLFYHKARSVDTPNVSNNRYPSEKRRFMGSGSLLVMDSGLKQGEKRRDSNTEGCMRKRASVPGEDWVESISTSPKVSQNRLKFVFTI